ncbi:helix-turn-helix domain-containing protein [Oceanivirga salmonicida]|uniref:helix-turn-helix domain-containing protein n=1 Tax=Oceanivirga salmonicida TaxID=1769291 RepID=UPI0012E2F705|nr:helix-turn-helix transcriptional regulator [Oceanivirga salmonicida]
MKKTCEILLKYIPSNMKRQALANLLEVKPQYLSNILNDRKKVSDKFLDKFYKLFDVLDEDTEQIKKYETFRKIPKNIREEIIEIKKEFTVFETIYLENKGTLSDDNFIISNDAEIMTIKKGIIYKQITKGDFFITVDTDKYTPFFKNDILIFKNLDFSLEANNKYCLVKYKSKIDLFYIKIIDNKIVLNSLCLNNDNYILNNKKNLHIYGYVCCSISGGQYE